MSRLIPPPLWTQDTSCTRLHVGGLPGDVTADSLVARFSKVKGVQVEAVDVVTDVITGYPKGFAYVMVSGAETSDPVQALINTYHRTKWRGRVLKVQPAREHYLVKLHREAREALLPRVERQRLERRRKLGLKDGDPDPRPDDEDDLFGDLAAAGDGAVTGLGAAKSSVPSDGPTPVGVGGGVPGTSTAVMPDWLMDSSDEDIVGKGGGVADSDGSDVGSDSDSDSGSDSGSGSGSGSDDGGGSDSDRPTTDKDHGTTNEEPAQPDQQPQQRLTFDDYGKPKATSKPETKTLFSDDEDEEDGGAGGAQDGSDADSDDLRFNRFPGLDDAKAGKLMEMQARIQDGGDSRFRVDETFLEPSGDADDADVNAEAKPDNAEDEDGDIGREIEEDQERGLAILDTMFGSRPRALPETVPPPPVVVAAPPPSANNNNKPVPGAGAGRGRRGFVSMNASRRYDPLRADAGAFELPMEPKKTKASAAAKYLDIDDDDAVADYLAKKASATPAPDLKGVPKVAQLGVSSWQQMMTDAASSGAQGFTLLANSGGGGGGGGATGDGDTGSRPAAAAFAFNFGGPPSSASPSAPSAGAAPAAPFAFNFAAPSSEPGSLKPVRDLGVRFGGGAGQDDASDKPSKPKPKKSANKLAAKPGSAALRFFAAPEPAASKDGDGNGDGAAAGADTPTDDWQARRLRLKKDYKRKLREMQSGRSSRRRR